MYKRLVSVFVSALLIVLAVSPVAVQAAGLSGVDNGNSLVVNPPSGMPGGRVDTFDSIHGFEGDMFYGGERGTASAGKNPASLKSGVGGTSGFTGGNIDGRSRTGVIGVTPNENKVVAQTAAIGNANASPTNTNYRLSAAMTNAGSNAAYAGNHIRGNGYNIEHFRWTNGTINNNSRSSWSPGHANAGTNVNLIEPGKQIGLAANLGSDQWIDTVVVYGGGFNPDGNVAPAYGTPFNPPSGTQEYTPGAPTPYGELIPFPSAHIGRIAVDVAVNADASTTWNTLPQSNADSPWTGSGSVADAGMGNWRIFAEPYVIPGDNDAVVYVFHTDTPVLARYVRLSIERVSANWFMTDSDGIAGYPVVVNSFEVYNMKDIAAATEGSATTAPATLGSYKGTFDYTAATPAVISTTIASGSTIAGVACADFPELSEGSDYTITGGGRTLTINESFLLSAPGVPTEWIDVSTGYNDYWFEITDDSGYKHYYRLAVTDTPSGGLGDDQNSGTYNRARRGLVSFDITVPHGNAVSSVSTGSGTLATGNYALAPLDRESLTRKLTFQPSYLDGLANGEHVYTVNFTSGPSATYTLTVQNPGVGASVNPVNGWPSLGATLSPVSAWYTIGEDNDVTLPMRTAGGVAVSDIRLGGEDGESIGEASWSQTSTSLTISKAYFAGKPSQTINMTIVYTDGYSQALEVGIISKSTVDYSVWQMLIPSDTTYSTSNLVNRNYIGWWYGGTGEYEGYDILKTTKNGLAGTGTSNARSELIERWPNGTSAGWRPAGYHETISDLILIKANGGVDNLSGGTLNFKTVIGQVFSAGSQMTELAVSNNMFFTFLRSSDASDSTSKGRAGLVSRGEGGIAAPWNNEAGRAYNYGWESGLSAGDPFRMKASVLDNTLKYYIQADKLSGYALYNEDDAWFQIYEETLNSSLSYNFRVGNYDQSASKVNPVAGQPNQGLLDFNTPSSSEIAVKNILVKHNPIQGRLTYANGEPVAGQAVHYTVESPGTSGTALTDHNGYYLIANVPNSSSTNAAAVTITVPEIEGLTSDKTGTIAVPQTALAGISGLRTGDAYNIVYASDGKTRVSVNGPSAVLTGEDAEYVVSATNLNKLATVTVWFEVDGKYLSGKDALGLNGFEPVGGVVWTQKDDSIWSGRVTLANFGGSVTAEAPTELLKLVFTVGGELGTSVVRITRIDLSGYDEAGSAVFFDSILYKASAETEIRQYYSPYDVNRDGSVDQLDLTAAQKYYTADKDDANWDEAKLADVNGDGEVDIEDLILILNHIEW